VVIGDQRAGDWRADQVVVPDPSCHREHPLGDADSDALEGPSAVLFQVKLPFEGVVDGLDQLADLLGYRLPVPLFLPLE
jgi:hypothetical protein